MKATHEDLRPNSCPTLQHHHRMGRYTLGRAFMRRPNRNTQPATSDDQLRDAAAVSVTVTHPRPSYAYSRPGEQTSMLATNTKREVECITTKLPPELLSYAFDLLSSSSDDVHAVRLACRTFCDAAWSAFGRTFNHKVFHILHRRSLQSLEAIASVGRAAPYITKLNVSTASFSNEGYRALCHWNNGKQDPLALGSVVPETG